MAEFRWFSYRVGHWDIPRKFLCLKIVKPRQWGALGSLGPSCHKKILRNVDDLATTLNTSQKTDMLWEPRISHGSIRCSLLLTSACRRTRISTLLLLLLTPHLNIELLLPVTSRFFSHLTQYEPVLFVLYLWLPTVQMIFCFQLTTLFIALSKVYR